MLGAVQPSADMTVSMLGLSQPVHWEKHTEGGIVIDMSIIPYDKLPCQWVWTFRLVNVA